MSFFELLGPTAVPTIICLIITLVMFVIELFTPGVGIAGATGLLSLIAVIVMQFAYGDPRVAVYIIAIALLIIILGLVWIIRSFQKGRLGKSFLVNHDHSNGTSVPEVAAAKEELLGKTGVAITILRPSGIAEFEGNRVGVSTSGEFIQKGEHVTVIKAGGMHILVRVADAEAATEE
jgi:membrane-bound serine protease (ClpP class)